MTLRIYDPNNVKVVLAGFPIQGFADGTMVEVSYVSDQFAEVQGTDGETSRSKTNDLRATVTIRTMQTSPSNDHLSALTNADLNADGGAGVGVFLLTDLSGNTILAAQNAWVKKFADQSFGRESTERPWTIMCAKLDSFIGSNV